MTTPECPHPSLRALATDGRCPLCAPHAAPVSAPVEPWTRDDDLRSRALAEQGRRKRERAQREIARRRVGRMRASLAEFVRGAWHVKHGEKPLEWGPHLQVLCQHVQWWLEGWLGRHADGTAGTPLHVQDFDFNLSPGTLKSEVVMVFGPAWMWLHAPTAMFGCVSGNPDNATRDSRAHRDLVGSAWYRETFGVGWTIRADQDGVGDWATTAGGKRQSQGLTAPAVGWHVDVLLIDDPDDWRLVHSEAKRKEVKLAVEGLGNRLNSLARSLRGLVQQKVHHDDESARRARAGVPRLLIPLTRDPKRPPVPTPWCPRAEWEWRAPGEVMAPDQFTAAVIAAEKKRLGTPGFRAQYEQDPEDAGSLFFPKAQWRWYRLEGETAPEGGWRRPEGASDQPSVVIAAEVDKRARTVRYDFDRIEVTIDATFGSLSATASRIGALAVGVRGADRFVLDDLSRRGGLGVCEDLIKTLVERWGATKVLVEKKANGAAVMERLASVISGLVETEPRGGKESRANAMRPAVEAGNWYLREGAPWLERGHDEDDDGFWSEVSRFGSGRGKNDRVDCMSQLEAEEGAGRGSPLSEVTPEQWAAALG